MILLAVPWKLQQKYCSVHDVNSCYVTFAINLKVISNILAMKTTYRYHDSK